MIDTEQKKTKKNNSVCRLQSTKNRDTNFLLPCLSFISAFKMSNWNGIASHSFMKPNNFM